MTAVKFTVAGRARTVVEEGNWRNDCPTGWAMFLAGVARRVGAGSTWTAVLDRRDALDLAWYLESVAAVWEGMTVEERGADDPRPLRDAVARIRAATKTAP